MSRARNVERLEVRINWYVPGAGKLLQLSSPQAWPILNTEPREEIQ